MDKKSKILFLTLLFLVVASIAVTYQRTMVVRDFEIITESTDNL